MEKGGIMDTSFHGFLNPSSHLQMGIQSREITHSGSDLEFSFPVIDNLGFHLFPNTPSPSALSEIGQDCNFSGDPLLRYINEMLMEEDMEDQTHMLQESLDFQAKEKSFYEAIGKKYPPPSAPGSARFSGSSDYDVNNPYLNLHSGSSNGSDCGGYLIDVINQGWIHGRNLLLERDSGNRDVAYPFGLCGEARPMCNFRKRTDEASFIPRGANSLDHVDSKGFSDPEPDKESDSRAKRNRHDIESDFLHQQEMEDEKRSHKIRAPDMDVDMLTAEFDSMLLNSMGEGREKYGAYREELRNAVKKDNLQKGRRSRRAKKQNKKKEVIDLRALLISCAQAVAADDSRSASDLLKKIRQHSSPGGDASQRLAHYFADGLEARMAGGQSPIFKSIVNRKTKASDYLRAYYTSLASAPLNKISNFATIQTIINETRKADRVHVIDFGILYGFQWPTFIQRISKRENGPPKVRITGIDFPQPGFRPAERVESTGRRLARYARRFGVPFEFNAIAQKWETIRPEILKIEKDEFLAVTCMYRAKNLPDETVMAHSARTSVLDLIHKIKPNIFIHGVVNGSYGAPFFLTRFREVLYHFSALFDMLEACVPREMPERTIIEKEVFGREAFNVVASEGWERVERPETYKQWQARNMRAGFMQEAFDREIVEEAVEKVRMFFHKDFLIDEQSKWVLLGWRGRIMNAISCWKPV